MSFFQSSFYSELNLAESFELFKNELKISFLKGNVDIDFRNDGLITFEGNSIGEITSYDVNKAIMIELQQLSNNIETTIKISISFESHKSGTLIITKTENLITYLQNDDKELLGWYVDNLITPVFKNLENHAFGDWLTDRTTRKPTGKNAKDMYSNPLFHWPNFYFLLDQMNLQASDYLLEVGCGGGVLLREVLKSGCKAAAIDHSPEMVLLARELNKNAIKQGKANIELADASDLPFHDNLFSHIVSTGVFQFIKNPLDVLREMNRVLQKNGTLFIFGGTKEMKGTPAAPEPYASRLKFYEDQELENLVKKSGFSEVDITQPDLISYAKKAGVPKDFLLLFEKKFSFLLKAKK